MSGLYNQEHVDYLKKIKFDKRLKQLEKKLKNKKILLYGAGTFFQDLAQLYDLSKLNIIGISDGSFNNISRGDTLLGYPKWKLNEISKLSPDYILVSTLYFVNIIEELEQSVDKKIKIRPLIKKPLKDLWKEVWR